MRSDFLKDRIVILDGAMGTVLQQKGLPPGGQPELLNLTEPTLLGSIYREYIAFCNYKGKRHAMLLKRRKAEFALLYVP